MQFRKEWVIPASVGIASFVAGFGVGYFVNQRRTKQELEEVKEEQLQLDFEYNERVRKFNHLIQEANHVVNKFTERGHEYLNGMIASLEEELPQTEEEIESILLAKSNHPSNAAPEEAVVHSEEEANVINIFSTTIDEWDYDVEVAHRTQDAPYIIHRDEFFGEEEGYSQSTITWYAGDDILCDENDAPIYNPERIVGTLIFGHGSNDPNVVYVRNDRLQAEYEVLRDDGHYVTEILGQHIDDEMAADDIKHARGVLRFRPE